MFSERSDAMSPSLLSVIKRPSPAKSTVAFGPVFSCAVFTMDVISRRLGSDRQDHINRNVVIEDRLAPLRDAQIKPRSMQAAADTAFVARGTIRSLLLLARPWQWIKNGLVLAALVFSHRLFIARDAALALFAFTAFCALSSSAYVLNDIVDREADRLNPEKRERPLAKGDLSVADAGMLAAGLGLFALAASAILGPAFLGIALLYVALQFGYSLWAKQRVIVDVIAVAVGFVLRAFAGGVAIDAEVSPWLIFITFVLALFLGLG